MSRSNPVGLGIHAHEGEFLAPVGDSAEWFGALAGPVTALVRTMLFPRRRIGLYDHAISAPHTLSFELLALGISLVMLPDGPVPRSLVPVAMLVHLACDLRGVYGIDWAATGLRKVLLGIGTGVASLALLAAWVSLAHWRLG